jgi:hypothetical protein
VGEAAGRGGAGGGAAAAGGDGGRSAAGGDDGRGAAGGDDGTGAAGGDDGSGAAGEADGPGEGDGVAPSVCAAPRANRASVTAATPARLSHESESKTRVTPADSFSGRTVKLSR